MPRAFRARLIWSPGSDRKSLLRPRGQLRASKSHPGHLEEFSEKCFFAKSILRSRAPERPQGWLREVPGEPPGSPRAAWQEPRAPGRCHGPQEGVPDSHTGTNGRSGNEGPLHGGRRFPLMPEAARHIGYIFIVCLPAEFIYSRKRILSFV